MCIFDRPKHSAPPLVGTLIGALGALLTATSAGTAWAAKDAPLLKSRAIPSFNEIDVNSDGLLSWSEVEAPLGNKLTAINWGRAEVIEMFDGNNDHYLDRAEHRNLIKSLKSALVVAMTENNARDPKNRFSFEAIDADDDGFVNAKELADVGLDVELRYRLFDNNEDLVLDKDEFIDFVSTLLIENAEE